MPRYTLFDGELVSKPWAAVLTEMRHDGVDFSVNEGHRTLARQRWFWHCFQTKLCNNGNLAAFPSPNAPHIRTGRIDHAIDFANPEAVMHWLLQHGLNPSRPAGAGTSSWEAWHIEVGADELRAAAKRFGRDVFDTLPKHVEHAVRQLLYHRRQAVEQAKPENGGKGPRYHKHVRWRNWWRTRVRGMLRRARSNRTKRILRSVLDI